MNNTFCICTGNDVKLLLTWGSPGGKEDYLWVLTPCALVAVVGRPCDTGLVTWLTWLPVEPLQAFPPSPKLAESLHFWQIGWEWWFSQLVQCLCSMVQVKMKSVHDADWTKNRKATETNTWTHEHRNTAIRKTTRLAQIGLTGHYIASWSEMSIDHARSPVIMTRSEQSCQVNGLLYIPTVPSLWSCQQAGEKITQFHASFNSG